ncbi:hypothetical protein JDV02_010662 [Purpureocillium takamizusanense]|uniref:Subtilisin-like protease n=1 Tax=Purpureocillium takamizusanense TaxID=2060973 RepID=A0A9Q8VHL5_9HYPO|nr:uncharacterized protein JDV02_010662 [Purpureocillium takamizusanense]UNI24947.1 hypothetical protein JDV02_010662 [Purpureocillium takamizusanense]
MVRWWRFAPFLAALSSAAPPDFQPSGKRFLPGAYIFELEDGHDSSALIDHVGSLGSVRMHYNYKLFKGLSVQLHDTETAHETQIKLASIASVKNSWPIQIFSAPKLEHPPGSISAKGVGKLDRRGNSTAPDTFSTHVMTQVDKLHAKGYTGKGVKIAIVDSGVDYKHESLGGCFGKGCLFSFGYDLTGDDYNGFNTPHPDDDPMDCVGHGTHVAGILAAQPGTNSFGVVGAAYDATFGIYKIQGCGSEIGEDVVIAGFNAAFEDGADIITASLGGPGGWSESPWSVVASRIAAHGVPCTMAAGNDGGSGLFFPEEAADAKNVMSIAMSDNSVFPYFAHTSGFSIDGTNSQEFAYIPSGNAKDTALWNMTMPLYATTLRNGTIDDLACDPLPPDTPDLSKYIVFIRKNSTHDECSLNQVLRNVHAKGGVYVLMGLYGPGALPVWLESGGNENGILAGGWVSRNTTRIFLNALQAGHNVTLHMKPPSETSAVYLEDENSESAGAADVITSWGPTWQMDMTPHFGAPGGFIISTWLSNKFAIETGTSMATPLAAACVALIGQVRGTFDTVLLHNLLSATAKPQLWNPGRQFFKFLAPVAQQGAGFIQAYDAAFATTLLQPSGLSFNDTDNRPESLSFVLSNKGDTEIRYNISHVPTVSMYTHVKDSMWSPGGFNEIVETSATLHFSDQAVTLPPGHRKVITVSAKPPQGLDDKRLPYWSGYVAINGTDGASLSLPYQGLSGSLHDARILNATRVFAWHSTGLNPKNDFVFAPPNTTFTLPNPGTANDTDSLICPAIQLAMGTRTLRCDIVPLTTCPPKNLTMNDPLGSGKFKTVGQPDQFPLRLVSGEGFCVRWAGLLDSGVYIPPGKYKFVIRALRIFGDPTKLQDWDMEETAPFYIKYRK